MYTAISSKNSKKGFTLIELLVVLSIVAILVAVVALALTFLIGEGEETGCEANRESLQVASVAYYHDAGAWPRTGADDAINYTLLAPDYITDPPESDSDCGWCVSDGGWVYVPDAKCGADKCPCCEDTYANDATQHSWCGTP